MATHRTKPKRIEEVTAIKLDAETVITGVNRNGHALAGDYLIQFANGLTKLMTREEFEAEYEPIPVQPLARTQPYDWINNPMSTGISQSGLTITDLKIS